MFNDADLINEINKNINKILKAAKSNGKHSLPGLLSQWLSFYGPVETGFIEKNFCLSKETLDDALSILIENEAIIIDEITGKNLIEICDTKNLEILLRIQRKKRIARFKPLNINYLSLFLSYFQNIIPDEDNAMENIEKLKSIIETLFGFPMSPELLEESIITSRIKSYYTTHLDNLILSTDLKWFGAGNKKIILSFIDDLHYSQKKKKAVKKF